MHFLHTVTRARGVVRVAVAMDALAHHHGSRASYTLNQQRHAHDPWCSPGRRHPNCLKSE
eukprot:9496279-Pyramimonas_sp.AAC.1